MVYAGKKGEQQFTLGVSGRLMDRNLVMWDVEPYHRISHVRVMTRD